MTLGTIRSMKKGFVLVVLYFACLSSVISQENWIITKSTVGEINVGMTVDALYNAVGKEKTRIVDLYIEGIFSPAIEIYFQEKNSPALICEIDCNQIWRINILDNNMKTEKGIGVNSSFDDLKKNYPNIELRKGENGMYAFVKEINLSFMLNTAIKDYDINSIPCGTKVIKILVL